MRGNSGYSFVTQCQTTSCKTVGSTPLCDNGEDSEEASAAGKGKSGLAYNVQNFREITFSSPIGGSCMIMDSDSEPDWDDDHTHYKDRLLGKSELVFWECAHKGHAARLRRILNAADLRLLKSNSTDSIEVLLLHCVCAESKFEAFEVFLQQKAAVIRHLDNADQAEYVEWARLRHVGHVGVNVRASSLAYIAHLTNSERAIEALKAEGVPCPWKKTLQVALRRRPAEESETSWQGVFGALRRRVWAGNRLGDARTHMQLFNAVESGDFGELRRFCEDHELANVVGMRDPRRDTTGLVEARRNEHFRYGWTWFCPNLLEVALLRRHFDMVDEIWAKAGQAWKPSDVTEEHMNNYWMFLLLLLSENNTAFLWLLGHCQLRCLKFFCKKQIPTERPKSLMATAAELGNCVVLQELVRKVMELDTYSDAERRTVLVQAVFAAVLSCQRESIEVLMPTFLRAGGGPGVALLQMLQMVVNLQSRSMLAVILSFLSDINVLIDDETGSTLLHASAIYNWPYGARILLHAGLDQTARDARNRTPSDAATRHSPAVLAVFTNFPGLSLFERCMVVVRRALWPYPAVAVESLPLPDRVKRALLYRRWCL